MLGGQYFYIGFSELYNNLGPDSHKHLQKREYETIWVMLILYVGIEEQIILPLPIRLGQLWYSFKKQLPNE